MPDSLKEIKIESMGGSYTPDSNVWKTLVGKTCLYNFEKHTILAVSETELVLQSLEDGNHTVISAVDMKRHANFFAGKLTVKLSGGRGQIDFALPLYSEKPGHERGDSDKFAVES
jgi:hypothetical protein